MKPNSQNPPIPAKRRKTSYPSVIKVESACFNLAIDFEQNRGTPKGYVSVIASNHAGQDLYCEFSLKNLTGFFRDVLTAEAMKTL